MPKLWRDGRWERVASVERGRMLVHSEEEWRELARRLTFVSGAMLLSIMFFSVLVAGLSTDAPIAWMPVALLLGALGYLLGAFIGGGWHLWNGGSLPGVYEHGVEAPWGRFVPYGEVMDLRRGTALYRRTLVLLLRPAGTRVGLLWDIFGVDGSDYVEARLRGAAPGERPRLVVFPAGAEGSGERGTNGSMK